MIGNERRGVQDGMAVYSADGERLGKVISCDAAGFMIEKGFFFPKEYFARYEHVASVQGDEIRLSLAKAALGEAGEGDLRSREAEGTATGMPLAGRTGGIALGDESIRERPREDEARMTRSEEQLDVVKREKEAGEVRLRKEVVTETKHIDVPVTREEVKVERRPIDAPRDALPGEASFREETISMPVREEEVEIRKKPVVKEEVRLRRETTQHEQRADAEVRSERIDVDDTTRTDDSTRSKDRDLGVGRGLGAPGRDDDLDR